MSAAVTSSAPRDKPSADEFWAAKWSKMDTPWRTLEREAGQPKYPHPMYHVKPPPPPHLFTPAQLTSPIEYRCAAQTR